MRDIYPGSGWGGIFRSSEDGLGVGGAGAVQGHVNDIGTCGAVGASDYCMGAIGSAWA